MPNAAKLYEALHGMQVDETISVQWRTGICSILRFSSGCHRKGHAVERGERSGVAGLIPWHLPIDPTDVGRSYDADVIRINSQSGKGRRRLYSGDRNYAKSASTPPKMREAMGYAAKAVSDRTATKSFIGISCFEPVSAYLSKMLWELPIPYHITEVHFQQVRWRYHHGGYLYL